MADAADRSESEETVLEQTLRRREALRVAMSDLERAIAAPVPGRTDLWRTNLMSALEHLDRALTAHVDGNECADGLFEQVLLEAPRLARTVERLRKDHAEMSTTVTEMKARVTGQGGDALDGESLREAGLALLDQIARHRHMGADLLYEAYTVDTSGGE